MKDAVVGGVALAPNVVETVTGLAVNNIKGVSCLGVKLSPVDKIFRLISSKSKTKPKIEVKSEDNKTLQIGVHVTIKYGTDILKVAKKIRKVVIEAVELQIGIAVSYVDVYIDAVEFD